jgi:hypothetical protein
MFLDLLAEHVYVFRVCPEVMADVQGGYCEKSRSSTQGSLGGFDGVSGAGGAGIGGLEKGKQ